MLSGDVISPIQVVGSGLVSRGPLLIWGFALTQTAGATLAQFRDGDNANAPERFRLRESVGPTVAIMLRKPIYFRRGLWVDQNVATSVVDVYVELLRDEMVGPKYEEPEIVEAE